jgi:geranylgeranyl diphosphate synthase type II
LEFKKYIKKKQNNINQALKKILPSPNNNTLSKAINYSIFSGGKRFRPILCISAHEMSAPEDENILNIASSIELFHTFTLIHDDLPSVDNDDYRRGKPTCHKVFGEAMALLAGDALFNLGYKVIINSELPEKTKISVLKEISHTLGLEGVVGGQAKDITRNKKTNISKLEETYLKKTASLIEASVKIGGIVACSGKKEISALSGYGKNLGLAFQIMDDVIEAKIKGKEENNYVALLGLDNAEKKAYEAIEKAKENLNIFGAKSKMLNYIADWCIKREN